MIVLETPAVLSENPEFAKGNRAVMQLLYRYAILVDYQEYRSKHKQTTTRPNNCMSLN